MPRLRHIDHQILCETPFDRGFVDSLKAAIPPHCRRWDPANRVWVVSDLWADKLLRVLDIYFGGWEWVDPTPPRPSVCTAHAELFVTPDAPKEVIIAAYRALAKLYHPDLNTSVDATVRMQRINAAYEELSR